MYKCKNTQNYEHAVLFSCLGSRSVLRYDSQLPLAPNLNPDDEIMTMTWMIARSVTVLLWALGINLHLEVTIYLDVFRINKACLIRSNMRAFSHIYECPSTFILLCMMSSCLILSASTFGVKEKNTITITG